MVPSFGTLIGSQNKKKTIRMSLFTDTKQFSLRSYLLNSSRQNVFLQIFSVLIHLGNLKVWRSHRNTHIPEEVTAAAVWKIAVSENSRYSIHF